MAVFSANTSTVPYSATPTLYFKDDLVEMIENVSPRDTPLFSLSGNTRANAIAHTWLIDALSAASTVTATQGEAFSPAAGTLPARLTNNCQINRKDFSVTLTHEAVSAAGIDGAFAYQASKKMLELANDSELALMQATVSTSDPRMMKGLRTWTAAPGAPTATSAATILTEDFFSGLQQAIWATSGVQPETCFVGAGHKRAITTWYTSMQRNVGENSKMIPMSIMQADTDFGMVNFILSRYCATFTSGTAAEGYLVHLPFIKKAWLQTPQIYRQAMTGDNIPGMIIQEWTLENKNPIAGGIFNCGTSSAFP